MLVVRVELHSAITGKVTELARMDIANVGGTAQRGDYYVSVMRGRSREALAMRKAHRNGQVKDYPRLRLHVWNLVFRALESVGYKGR